MGDEAALIASLRRAVESKLRRVLGTADASTVDSMFI
jgi:hypothetical protein